MDAEMRETTYINLFAGPGSGKSTTAAGLFSRLKLAGRSAELITEFAKDLTWEENTWALSNQYYVWAMQLMRQKRVLGKVDWAVTDSPILMQLIYHEMYYDRHLGAEYAAHLGEAIRTSFIGFKSLNYFVERGETYDPVGRNQTHEESKVIDRKIKAMLVSLNVPFRAVQRDTAVDQILEDIA